MTDKKDGIEIECRKHLRCIQERHNSEQSNTKQNNNNEFQHTNHHFQKIEPTSISHDCLGHATLPRWHCRCQEHPAVYHFYCTREALTPSAKTLLATIWSMIAQLLLLIIKRVLVNTKLYWVRLSTKQVILNGVMKAC